MQNLLTKKILFLVVLTTCLGVFTLKAQVGGPYTADDHTMLLLHFDGDLKNASPLTTDGEFHGDLSNFYFLNNSVTNLNKCLRIDNDSQSDSAFVTVADAPALDLTGDWTIEGWINIFTFGEGSDDWRWVPRLVIKTGDEVFWQPNYFVEMWGSTRFFSCGYNAASKDQWPQANSPDNTMVPGQWYHMAFIR
ncbi:LamG domain-containing protein, partial [candidate division KSB1 bacterium]|nr:LamG domain-containing protein [candidate division KSB1 bacterium]